MDHHLLRMRTTRAGVSILGSVDPARTVSLVFADMKDPVREKIERYELTRTIDPAHFFLTVGAAVAAFQDQFGADWVSVAGKQTR
jgi:hypothetical protein